MVSAAFAFALGGGCPGKQLVNIGEGNNDSALFVARYATGCSSGT